MFCVTFLFYFFFPMQNLKFYQMLLSNAINKICPSNIAMGLLSTSILKIWRKTLYVRSHYNKKLLALYAYGRSFLSKLLVAELNVIYMKWYKCSDIGILFIIVNHEKSCKWVKKLLKCTNEILWWIQTEKKTWEIIWEELYTITLDILNVSAK